MSLRILTLIVKLQAGFRGYKLRRDMDQEYAAIQIQARRASHAEWTWRYMTVWSWWLTLDVCLV